MMCMMFLELSPENLVSKKIFFTNIFRGLTKNLDGIGQYFAG